MPYLSTYHFQAAGTRLFAATMSGFIANIIPVTLGNIFGGSVMVGMSLYVVYLYGREDEEG